jgi:hypothetical protein
MVILQKESQIKALMEAECLPQSTKLWLLLHVVDEATREAIGSCVHWEVEQTFDDYREWVSKTIPTRAVDLLLEIEASTKRGEFSPEQVYKTCERFENILSLLRERPERAWEYALSTLLEMEGMGHLLPKKEEDDLEVIPF